MKKTVLFVLLISVVIISPLWAIGGLGAYYVGDQNTMDGSTEGDFPISLIRDGFEGTQGGGLFLYVDALPFVDFEASVETALNTYQFQFENAVSELPPVDFGWARVSYYLTLRRELVGFGVPILGGVKLHAGLGYNGHRVTPLADLNLVDSLVDGGMEAGFESSDLEDNLISFLEDNMKDFAGYHIQIGTQVKLLALNAFINYRISFTDEIFPGDDDISSLWFGLALGI